VSATERLRRLVPAEIRSRVAGRLLPTHVQHRLASRAFHERYAWARTQVVPLPTWTTGLLRANVAGREAEGVVAPDALEGVLAEATRLVLETVDPATGGPIAKRDHRLEPDRPDDPRPDLLVEWTAGPPARAAAHPELGGWELERRHGHAWSHHRGRGLAFLAGPGVPAIPGLEAEDRLGLAPTLLALAGVRTGGRAWSLAAS
jgi:hypothetical protein